MNPKKKGIKTQQKSQDHEVKNPSSDCSDDLFAEEHLNIDLGGLVGVV